MGDRSRQPMWPRAQRTDPIYDIPGLGARGSPRIFSAGPQGCRLPGRNRKNPPRAEAWGRANFSSTITLLSKTTKSTPGLSRPWRNRAENSRRYPENLPPKSLMSCRLAFVTGAFCHRHGASQESLHNDTMDSLTGKRLGGKVKRSANVSSLRVLARIQ